MKLLAPVITHPVTVLIVIAALVFWAFASAIFFWRGARKIRNSLDRATARVTQTDGPLGFARDYETLRTALAADPVVASPWEGFCESLVLPTRSGRSVRATRRASEWFNLGLFRSPAVGVDLRYHAALPNLLVGAGLFFTFLGLAAALTSAGSVVSGDAAVRNDALRTLLTAASFKFVTSLFGLLLSILYTVLRKSLLKSVDRSLDQFIAAVDARAPLITPALLQQEANSLLEQQSTQLESFSNDLAVNLAGVFDNAFNNRLGEHIGPLTDAMQRLAEGMSSRNEDALKEMLDQFVVRLQGGAGERVNEVAESLGSLGQRLEGLQTGLGDAAIRMSQSADAMAARMGEGAEAALSRITDQFSSLAETLRLSAEQTRSAGAEAGGELARRIDHAATSFEESARTVATTLADAVASMSQNMGRQSEESAGKLAGQFEAMVADLRQLADASRSTGQEALGALATQITASSAGFEQTASRIATALETAATQTGGALGRGAEQAVDRIAVATEGMRTELQQVLQDFRASIAATTEELRAGGAAGATSFREHLGGAGDTLAGVISTAADRLAQAGATTASSLERGGEAASSKVSQATNAFGERAADLASQVDRVSQSSSDIVQRLKDFHQAIGAAAQPLATVSTNLRAASESVRDGAEPLTRTSQALAQAFEQVTGATQRLETAGQSAARLIESLNAASQRFEGVDRNLANVLAELQKGLEAFTRQVSGFVNQTDQNLSRAATQLGSLVKGLQDTLEDNLSLQSRKLERA